MANNRLYIVNDETGEEFTLAKSDGSGWYVWQGAGEFVQALNEFLGPTDGDAAYGNCNTGPSRLRLVTEQDIIKASKTN